jgi:ketosteroid isomerase-like protein
MSEENVEIALRQWELWNAGDLDAFAQRWAPNVTVFAPEGWPEGEVSEGIEAWKLQAQRLRDTWAEARVEVDEIQSVGSDRVFARIRYVTRGSDLGFSFDTPMAVVLFVKDRKITRAHFFWDADAAEARALAGLSE